MDKNAKVVTVELSAMDIHNLRLVTFMASTFYENWEPSGQQEARNKIAGHAAVACLIGLIEKAAAKASAN